MYNFDCNSYYLPYKNPTAIGENDFWVIEPIKNSNDGKTVRTLNEFNYTVLTGYDDRLTFKYSVNSVEPSPRTYRWYGVNANRIAGRYSSNTRKRKQPSWEDKHTMPYDNYYFGKVFEHYCVQHEDEIDAQRHAALDRYAARLDDEEYAENVQQTYPYLTKTEILLGIRRKSAT